MGFFNTIIRFFQDGGHFMYPIAVVAVIGLVIAVERWVYLTVASVRNRSLWNELTPLLGAGNFKQAVALTSGSDSAIGQILNYGLARVQSARRRDDIEKAMEESLMEVLPRLEKRTHYLATFANLATLLLEPDIPYDVLVAVMDKVRVAEQVDTVANRVARTDLFPDISIGDAPVQD